jgi:hypothetical protein
MRIAIGQLWQETNTFNRCATTLADFQNWGIATGADVLQKFGETGELGGFVAGTFQWNSPPELVGLARFLCWPSGRVNREAWEAIQETFLNSLDEAGHVDGVLIAVEARRSAPSPATGYFGFCGNSDPVALPNIKIKRVPISFTRPNHACNIARKN